MSEATSVLIDVDVEPLIIAKVTAYLEYMLLDKARRGRKTDYVSAYLVNHTETQNSQDVPHVVRLCDFLAPTTEGAIALLRQLALVRREYRGDNILQALLLASIDGRDYFGKRKVAKQLMIFTDKVSELDLSAEELQTLHEELDSRIILVDCSTHPHQNAQGSQWDALVRTVKGSMSFHIDELLLRITQTVPKVVKPVTVFSGQLRLGASLENIVDLEPHRRDEAAAADNPKKRQFPFGFRTEANYADDHCLCIGVQGYPATKKTGSLQKKTVVKDASKPGFVPVKSVIDYELRDNEVEGEGEGKGEGDAPPITVARESITKAYRYGTDYVVLPSSLEDQLVYQTYAGLDIRGFMNRSDMHRHFLTSESVFVVSSSSSADQITFSALIDAMIQIDKIAIGRYVPKNNSDVQMCMLYPMILEKENGTHVRTLILNRLPFTEDERIAIFPRLTREDDKKSEKDETIDQLMAGFVESRSMDDLPRVEEKKYYEFYEDSVRDTTLVLPMKSKDETRERDPLMVPAMGLHRQLQVMLEYLHQVVINKSEKFDPPELQDHLKAKITPHIVSDFPELEELVNLLELKKVEPKSKEFKPPAPAEPVPSLEELLKRGEAAREGGS
ncbi:Ku70/Ku80 N-terminal alpha/beta domain [Nakaseomyces glabratus]